MAAGLLPGRAILKTYILRETDGLEAIQKKATGKVTYVGGGSFDAPINVQGC
jgi:hypothetical protein